MNESTFDFLSDPRLILEIAKEQLSAQLATVQALETKMSTLYAAGAGLLGLLLAVYALRANELRAEEWALAAGALGVFGVLTWATFFGFWLRRFEIGPTVEAIWLDAQTKHESRLIAELAIDYGAAIKRNASACEAKERAVRTSFHSVLGLTLMLLGALVLRAT